MSCPWGKCLSPKLLKYWIDRSYTHDNEERMADKSLLYRIASCNKTVFRDSLYDTGYLFKKKKIGIETILDLKKRRLYTNKHGRLTWYPYIWLQLWYINNGTHPCITRVTDTHRDNELTRNKIVGHTNISVAPGIEPGCCVAVRLQFKMFQFPFRLLLAILLTHIYNFTVLLFRTKFIQNTNKYVNE